MAHFAKVSTEKQKVIKIIVAEQAYIDSLVETEPGKWLQASYNTKGGVHYDQNGNPSADQSKALRYNYPSSGFLYSSVDDAFYDQQPFPSWTLNTSTYLWEAHLTKPSDDNEYQWNEETYQSNNTQGWEVVNYGGE